MELKPTIPKGNNKHLHQLSSSTIDHKGKREGNFTMDLKSVFIPPNMIKKETDPRSIKLYEQILRNSRYSSKHLDNIREFGKEERQKRGDIIGRASTGIYKFLLNERSFDDYGRPIKGQKLDKSSRDVVFRETTRTDLKEITAKAKEEIEDIVSSQEPVESSSNLTSQPWKIGKKTLKFGPPGCTGPPIEGISNSEGNEKHFSYDGEWKDGKMEGEGVYKFSDGYTYEGLFRRNFPNGHGKAIYPNGTVYIGDWESGYPHGEGRVVYQGGITYEGYWKEGRRDGEGHLSFPNGSFYKGGFQRGRFHGRGTFSSKGSGLVYTGGFYRGNVSGRCIISFPGGRRVTKEWPKGPNFGLNLFDAIASVEKEKLEATKIDKSQSNILAVKHDNLQKYVEKVREAIEEKRKKEKDAEIEERRKTIRATLMQQRRQQQH